MDDDTFNNGGPARDMTLRDYIAIKALERVLDGLAPKSLALPRDAANMAYGIANAMIEERRK